MVADVLQIKIYELAKSGKSIAYKILQNEGDAEDAVFDAFLRTFHRMKTEPEQCEYLLKNEDLFKAYIYISVRNTAFNKSKRKIKYNDIDEPIIKNKIDKNNSGESDELLKEIIRDSKQEAMNKFFKILKAELPENLQSFQEALFKVMETDQKCQIARVGERLKISNNEAHNLWRRWKRQYHDSWMKHPEFHEYKTKRKLFNFKIFKPIKTKKLKDGSAKRITDRIMKHLDNESIDILLQVF